MNSSRSYKIAYVDCVPGVCCIPYVDCIPYQRRIYDFAKGGGVDGEIFQGGTVGCRGVPDVIGKSISKKSR